ncbi:transport protein [Salmonella enterica subsp. diarizonae]|uniref:Transport protein n=1 Tax=Salmonella diarizonae TaxID=59204 RepID=A0A379U141_SALDZ|nr:transport protein [Salmonella enterica subsp. diarizonae]
MPNVQEKQLRWYNIALMSFITVWGFGNVVNNYANQGLVVVFSWVFIFALYFIPYALIVGQLGSTFKEGKGGVSTWIKHTMGPGLAYLAAWTYWWCIFPTWRKSRRRYSLLWMGVKRRRLVDKRVYRRCLAGADAGIVCFLYVGCFPGDEIAKGCWVCGRDCHVYHVNFIRCDGSDRAGHYKR